MAGWKHELTREQYELVIDGILRASVIATVIEETAADLDPATLKEMAKTMRERVLECLVLGRFDDDDVKEIHQSVLKSMYTRPDA